MKQTKSLMGMSVTAEIVDARATKKDLQDIFDYFKYVDSVFSTYKKDSEISKIQRGELKIENAGNDVKTVFKLSEQTKKQTNGYFDIWPASTRGEHNGILDPSGLVKGWAIWNACKLLQKKGFKNFYVNAGGDIQVEGLSFSSKKWKVGIKNPFNQKEIVKVLCLTNCGIATSGNYERGEHIYNPKGKVQNEISSFTVIGPDIYEADRFATAAFAMGKKGIEFISDQRGLEGYMIDKDGIATFTAGFEKFVC